MSCRHCKYSWKSISNVSIEQGRRELLCSELPLLWWGRTRAFIHLSALVHVHAPQHGWCSSHLAWVWSNSWISFLADGKDGLGWDLAVWADCWGCAGSCGCREALVHVGDETGAAPVLSVAVQVGVKIAHLPLFQLDRKKMCQFSLNSYSFTYFFGETFQFYITRCRNWNGVFSWWVKLESILQHLLRSNL